MLVSNHQFVFVSREIWKLEKMPDVNAKESVTTREIREITNVTENATVTLIGNASIVTTETEWIEWIEWTEWTEWTEWIEEIRINIVKNGTVLEAGPLVVILGR